jgi:anti-anti-sigma factor
VLLEERGAREAEMNRRVFEMKVSEAADQSTNVGIHGVISAETGSTIANAFEQVRDGGAQSMVLDFSDVDSMDSPGVSLLVKLCIQARRNRIKVLATGLRAEHRDVFRLTGLDEAISVQEIKSPETRTEMPSVQGSEPGQNKGSPVQPEASREQPQSHEQLWARPVPKLQVNWASKAAGEGLNVEARRPVGPIAGFGPMWEKTYELRLADSKLEPSEVIQTLKERLPEFQPPQNHFRASPSGIKSGEIVLIRSSVLGIPIHTGVLVSYADNLCFTLMTPQGHPESGWVTFRAFRESSDTVCQIQGLARANDPIYEIAFRFHGSEIQEKIWKHVLGSLAQHLGAPDGATMRKQMVDSRMQWAQITNVRYNAQILTIIYLMLWPFRKLTRLVRK